jgi:hypothetical protein
MDSHRPEAIPTNPEASLAVMAVEIRYAREALDRIESAQQATVSRNEWEQRNTYVDARFTTILEKFTDVNAKFAQAAAELATKRVPWTAIGAFFVGAGTFLFVIIDKVAN